MSLISKLKKDKKLAEYTYAKSEEETKFISTGVISINLLFSGRIDGGIPIGKINMIAADSSLGKSFTALKVAQNAQKMGMEVILIDSEYAYDEDFANNIGIDDEKIYVYQNNQIEDIQKFIMSTYEGLSKPERRNILLIIDSWNAMVTSKTVDDATSGKDVSDMTISKKKNTLARLLTGIHTTGYIVNQIYACVNGETLVQTPDGDINIKDIKVGDTVMTSNGEEKVQNTFEYKDSIVYEVEMEDGTTIDCTENHKFYVKLHGEKDVIYRWIPVGELTPDMEVMMSDFDGEVPA